MVPAAQLELLGAATAELVVGCHRHIIVDIDGERHRACLLHPDVAPNPVFMLPPESGFPERHAATARLVNALSGKPDTRPARYHPTDFQRHRLGVLLRIARALAHHLTLREITRTIIAPALPSLPATEWKGCSERRNGQRLVQETRHLIADGYRTLVQCRAYRRRGRQ